MYSVLVSRVQHIASHPDHTSEVTAYVVALLESFLHVAAVKQSDLNIRSVVHGRGNSLNDALVYQNLLSLPV